MASPLRTGLPREVLQWLQNLQLSLCLRNMRRDFSNGYLIADIFSRYYPKYFLLFSFRNGAALSIKQDNWRRIQKFLQKLNINLSQDLINGTMHLEMGAAQKLLTEMYTVLTKQRTDFGSLLSAAQSDLSTDRERRDELLQYKQHTPAETHKGAEKTLSSAGELPPGSPTVLFKEIEVRQPIRRRVRQ